MSAPELIKKHLEEVLPDFQFSDNYPENWENIPENYAILLAEGGSIAGYGGSSHIGTEGDNQVFKEDELREELTLHLFHSKNLRQQPLVDTITRLFAGGDDPEATDLQLKWGEKAGERATARMYHWTNSTSPPSERKGERQLSFFIKLSRYQVKRAKVPMIKGFNLQGLVSEEVANL